LRPIVGAIFGVAAYFALKSGFINVGSDSFYYYAFISFRVQRTVRAGSREQGGKTSSLRPELLASWWGGGTIRGVRAHARISNRTRTGDLLGAPSRARRGDLLAFRSQQAEERADLELALSGVSHGRVRVHGVSVTSPDPLASHVTSVDEIPDDSLRRALSHTHHLGYIAQARVRAVLDAQENL
jgi:hypothetical protein